MRTGKRFASGLVFLVCFATPFSALAQGEPWNTPYDRHFAKADLVPEFELREDGTERRSVMLPGKVLLEQIRKNGQIEQIMTDHSGLGAVMCAKAIYWEIKVKVDNCSDLQNERLSRLLAEALSRIDGFIVENSIDQVSWDDIAKSDHIRLEHRLHDLGLKGDEKTGATCKKNSPSGAEFAVMMSKNILDGTDDEFLDGVDEMLSVPRVPALNPCL